MELAVSIVWAVAAITIVAALHFAPLTVTIHHTTTDLTPVPVQKAPEFMTEADLKKDFKEEDQTVSFQDALNEAMEALGGTDG